VNKFQKIQVVHMKAACRSAFSQDMSASAASDADDSDLTSGLVADVTIDISMFILIQFHTILETEA